MLDSTNAGILRYAQNDTAQWFFSNLLELGHCTLRVSVRLCFKAVEPEVKLAPKVSA